MPEGSGVARAAQGVDGDGQGLRQGGDGYEENGEQRLTQMHSYFL